MDKSLMQAAPVAIYRSPVASVGGLFVGGYGSHRVTRPIERRRLPVFAVVLVERGAGWLRTEAAGLRPFAAPALLWLVAGRQHSYGPARGTAWEERWALFEGRLAGEFVASRLIDEADPVVALRDVGDMQRLFATLHAEMRDDTMLGRASAASTLHRIVVQAARQATVPQAARQKGSQAEGDALVEALRRRAMEAVDLAAFAAAFDMSPATLRRKFIAASGLSPKAFQLRLRIDRAKELLATTDRTIEAIASAVGMDDPFYFSRLFQDREACSPREFRNRHRRS